MNKYKNQIEKIAGDKYIPESFRRNGNSNVTMKDFENFYGDRVTDYALNQLRKMEIVTDGDSETIFKDNGKYKRWIYDCPDEVFDLEKSDFLNEKDMSEYRKVDNAKSSLTEKETRKFDDKTLIRVSAGLGAAGLAGLSLLTGTHKFEGKNILPTQAGTGAILGAGAGILSTDRLEKYFNKINDKRNNKKNIAKINKITGKNFSLDENDQATNYYKELQKNKIIENAKSYIPSEIYNNHK